MKKHELLKIVLYSFIISLGCVMILEHFKVDILTFKGVKSALSISTLLSVWWTFYFNYGWKWPIIKFAIYKKNINGTWFGTFNSKSVVDNKKYSGEISLVIKQSFLNIHIASYTKRFATYSYSEVLTYEKKSARDQIVYVYSQEQADSDDHNVRKGTSELELTISKGKKELHGKFWTNSGTVGYMKVKQISKKQIKDFKDASIISKGGKKK